MKTYILKLIGASIFVITLTSCNGNGISSTDKPIDLPIVATNFTDSTSAAGLGGIHTSWSSAWRDFDLDGWPDLFVSNHGPLPSLYRNNRDGTFSDLSATLPLAVYHADVHGSAWANIDTDMEPELMIEQGANQGSSTSSKFLLDQVGAAYVDIASNVGLLDPFGRGRVPLWTDTNGDGLLDIILMNEIGGIGEQSLGMRFFCRDAIGQFADCTPRNLPSAADRYSLVTDINGDYRGELVLFYSGNLAGYATLGGGLLSVKPFLDTTDEKIYVDSVSNAQSGDFNGDGLMDILLIRSFQNSVVETWGPYDAKAFLQAISREESFGIETTGDLYVTTYTYDNRIVPQNIYIGAAGRHPAGCSVNIETICTITLSSAADTGMFPHVGGQNTGLYIGYDPIMKLWIYSLSSAQGVTTTAQLVVNSNQSVSVVSKFPEISLDSYILYNLGNDQFSKVIISDASGAKPYGCADAAVADFDNNGALDIIFTCRNAVRTLGYKVYWNAGGGTFQSQDITLSVGGVAEGIADSPSSADFDQNGFPDVFIPHGHGASPFNLGNHKFIINQGNANHWLAVDLVGMAGNLDAVGAVVTVRAGGITQRRYAVNGASHHAQNDRILIFGLGSNTIVDSLDVHWPDGSLTSLANVLPDKKLLISHPLK